MRLLLIFTAMLGFLFHSSHAALEMNDTIPAVNSTDQNGEAVDLAAIGAEGYLLVYFYPKADTPGCTKQACSLRDAYAEVQDKGIKVVGVSMDSAEAQKKFAKKYRLPFTLLADESAEVVNAFGVPKMGKFPSRQAFLFQNGKLIWKDEKASTAKQAEDVLKVVAERS
ncbi:MAG: peroxiredoxin [Gammaproteobacteria bacterium]|nr:peroxiredoxin [Gammaproteobacteria bacterium]